jgi:hypothetical protein
MEYVVLTGLAVAARQAHPLDAGLRRLLMTLCGAGLCLLIGRLLDRIPPRPAAPRWLAAVVLAVLAGVLWTILGEMVSHVHPPAAPGPGGRTDFGREVARYSVALGWLFIAWCCGALAIDFHRALSERETRLATAERSVSQANRQVDTLARLLRGARGAETRTELWVPTRRGEVRLALETVEYLEAEHDYVRIHTAAGRHLLHGALQKIYDEIDPERFLRVHRSFVINLEQVARMDRRGRGRFDLVLASGARIPVGRTYAQAVRDRLRGLGAGTAVEMG